jgi:hypothetical protein
MKTTDLEDYEKLITRDYLDARLTELRLELKAERLEIKAEFQQLRGDLLQQLMANQRWTTGLIVGAYTLVIGLHFLK